MKRTNKICLTLLLALLVAALVCVGLTAAAKGETIVDRGSCGASLRWTLDIEGTLTFSGTGEMERYSADPSRYPQPLVDSPWYGDNRIKTVVVSSGVSSVSPFAFADCGYLETVVFPESLTEMDFSMFYGCGALKYILFAGSEAQWNGILTDDSSASVPDLCPSPYSLPDIRFNVVDWGYCFTESDSDCVVWLYDGTKTLTFFGNGAVMDQPGPVMTDNHGNQYPSSSVPPWLTNHAGDIDTVVLEEGITGAESAGVAPAGVKELIVLNRACDLSALKFKETVFLRGYLDSTAETYANTHGNCVFMPLCPVDYRHTVTLDMGDASTCSYNGHDAGIYCSECDKYFFGHEMKPRLSHTWSEWTVTQEPTTEQEGCRTHTCILCGISQIELIDKLSGSDSDTGTGIVDDYDNSGGNGGGNGRGGIWVTISYAMKGLVAWFKKLLSFFSK